MKKCLPWIILAVFAGEALMALRPRAEGEFHLREFGRLPVLLEGRVQPIDSAARNSLLQIRSTQEVPLQFAKSYEFWKHPPKLRPTEWLLEVMTNPDQADERRIFLIHHPELLAELKLQGKGVEKSGLHYFSFNEIKPVLDDVERLGRQIADEKDGVFVGVKEELRTPFQKQVIKLQSALVLYRRLKNTVHPETSTNFVEEITQYQSAIAPGIAAARAEAAGQSYDKVAFERLEEFINHYGFMDRAAYIRLVPPSDPVAHRTEWETIGTALLQVARGSAVPPAVQSYAAMATAYRQSRAPEFNRAVTDYRTWLSENFQPELKKGIQESYFNNYMPFFRAMLIYIVAFVLGCIFWFNWSEWLRRSAFYLVVLGWIIHTCGLVFRMYLEGRPPVTNLYSSAIFIGWGSVGLGLILERIYKDGIGTVVAALMGFVTQIIAHNLALGGDTMIMLRAVLDTNFWLATHVVVVTLGYASTFVAGFLAVIYIMRGVFTRTLSENTAKGLTRMVYGIICFATLFSFVGTVLGGIWADQSWGRFWGWDPKENGALIIVLWNALILHARWGGMIRERGLMNMAIFGNIVTSFSWFGVNMLGIGLHSYGFMDSAAQWLYTFIIIQIALISLGLIPRRLWMSFQAPA